MTTASESWTESERHPLDDETRPVGALQDPGYDDEPEVVVGPRGRGLGANRHFASTLLAMLSVPGAYLLIDYGYYRAIGSGTGTVDQANLPQNVVVTLAIGAGLLFLAAFAGRLSAVGPMLAGLVWGIGPLVWISMDFSSYRDRLNDLPEIYDFTGFGLYTAGFALFPAVAGLLIGTAVAGRWRRHRPAAPRL